MNDKLAAFIGLETQIHELHYISILWAKLEDEKQSGGTQPDGTFIARYDDSEAAEIHCFLGYEIERRASALRQDFLACFALGRSDV